MMISKLEGPLPSSGSFLLLNNFDQAPIAAIVRLPRQPRNRRMSALGQKQTLPERLSSARIVIGERIFGGGNEGIYRVRSRSNRAGRYYRCGREGMS
jgi:hypothetical protein